LPIVREHRHGRFDDHGGPFQRAFTGPRRLAYGSRAKAKRA
jgi:hypothetical protein